MVLINTKLSNEKIGHVIYELHPGKNEQIVISSVEFVSIVHSCDICFCIYLISCSN